MEEKQEKVGFSIVAKIMSILKLDDKGKVESFFTREVKNFNRAVKNLKQNLEALKAQYEQDIETLDEKIEDLKDALANAYTNVKVEDIQSNADMDIFSTKYWSTVDCAIAAVEREEQAKKDREEIYNKKVEVS